MQRLRRFTLVAIFCAVIVVIFVHYRMQPFDQGDYGDRIPPSYSKTSISDRNLVLANGVSGKQLIIFFHLLSSLNRMTVPRIGFGTAALGTNAGSAIKAALDYGNNLPYHGVMEFLLMNRRISSY